MPSAFQSSSRRGNSAQTHVIGRIDMLILGLTETHLRKRISIGAAGELNREASTRRSEKTGRNDSDGAHFKWVSMSLTRWHKRDDIKVNYYQKNFDLQAANSE
jgi:hypothetical protein